MGVKLVEHRVAVAKVARRHRIGPLSHTMTGDIREWRIGIKAYHILSHFVNGFRVESQRHWAAHWVRAINIRSHTGEEVTEAWATGGWRWRSFLRWIVSPRWWVFHDILVLYSFGAASQGTVLWFLRYKSGSSSPNVRLPFPLPAKVSIVKHLFTVWVQSPVIPFSFQRGQKHIFRLKICTQKAKSSCLELYNVSLTSQKQNNCMSKTYVFSHHTKAEVCWIQKTV